MKGNFWIISHGEKHHVTSKCRTSEVSVDNFDIEQTCDEKLALGSW